MQGRMTFFERDQLKERYYGQDVDFPKVMKIQMDFKSMRQEVLVS